MSKIPISPFFLLNESITRLNSAVMPIFESKTVAVVSSKLLLTLQVQRTIFLSFTKSYIISGGCFALSLILFYVLFAEILYRKGNDEVLKENTTPRETIITLSKSWMIFKAVGYGFFMVFGGYLIYLTRDHSGEINFQEDYLLVGIGSFFIIGFSLIYVEVP